LRSLSVALTRITARRPQRFDRQRLFQTAGGFVPCSPRRVFEVASQDGEVTLLGEGPRPSPAAWAAHCTAESTGVESACGCGVNGVGWSPTPSLPMKSPAAKPEL